ncbi:N,N-dimethylformamidase beta subunit family domain-containing protein [Micromonospora arborensis]|uniref:N,N-dimethylformamidase beta subunit family domain-containing protein n=1 Tax=Micromonospora arborensis TaxID=2116518 RepID=UPI0033D38401
MAVARVRQGGAWVESALAGKVRSGGAWVAFGPDGDDEPDVVSLFGSQVPAVPTLADPSTSLTLGTVVNVTEAGKIVGGRWRSGTIPAGMVATYVLYDNATRTALRRQAFTSPTAGAWNEITFAVPYPVEAGASLIAAVHLAGTSGGVAYAYTAGFFASAGVTSGGVTAPAGGGDPLSIGNGRFIVSDGYPSSTYNSTNYFVDLLYEGTAVGAGGDVALTGPDRPVLAGESVTMNVAATNLGGGETTTGYAWTVRSGGGSLSSSSTATPAYTAPSGAGVAVVRATVTTSLGRTGWVDVRVGYASTIVAAENLLPGTLRATWDLPSGSFGGHAALQGFADGFSVDKSETVPFKIGQSDSAGWTAQVYRLGWYGGTGARLIATLAPDSTQLAASQSQPAPADVDPVTTLLSADCAAWATTLEWTPPAWAPSGMYVLRLNRVGGGASHVMFVLRDDDRTADLMLMPSDSTWHAYNAWGGLGSGQYAGNSLYYGTAVNQYNPDAARYVSYNRPIVNRGSCDPGRDYGAVRWSNFWTGEYPMVRFLERNGYDIKYYSCLDAAGDPDGDLLTNVGAAMMVGHNEYWSDAMRSGWEAAKAAGTSVFSCAGNEVFWRLVGSAPDSSGRPRTWECYKSTIDSRGSTGRTEWTGTWRDPSGAGKGGDQPENTLTGTIFVVNGPDLRSLVVPADGGYSATPLWRHTAVAALTSGQTWASPSQILGFEWDTYGPAGTSGTGSAYMADPHADSVYCSDVTYSIASGVLLTGPGDEYDAAGTATHRLVVHPGGDGALAFGTGTINWALGVDSANVYQNVGNDNTSTVIQQATVNVLADMGATAATLMSGLTAPSPVDWWDDAPPPTGEAWTLGTPAGATDTSDSAVSLGTPFGVTEAGDWTGVRVWVTPTAPSISPSVVAYNVDAGTRLALKTYTEPPTRGAYHDVLFDAPVPVVPGVTYQVAIHTTRFGYTHRDSLALPMESSSERVYSGSDGGTLCLFRYESSPGSAPLTSFTTSYAHMAPIVAFD